MGVVCGPDIGSGDPGDRGILSLLAHLAARTRTVPLPPRSVVALDFQCERCFDLACEECVTAEVTKDAKRQATCRACGATCQAIDWSGLAMGKKEALLGLLPEPVHMAMEYLAKRKGKTPP